MILSPFRTIYSDVTTDYPLRMAVNVLLAEDLFKSADSFFAVFDGLLDDVG